MRNWFKKQNNEMIELQVDDTERRIIVRALADLINNAWHIKIMTF